MMIEIYQDASVTGSPFRTLLANPDDTTGAYAASPPPIQALPDGTYTARALQSDAAGNTGQSPPNTFTLDTTGTAGSASVTAGVLDFGAAGGVANRLTVAPVRQASGGSPTPPRRSPPAPAAHSSPSTSCAAAGPRSRASTPASAT